METANTSFYVILQFPEVGNKKSGTKTDRLSSRQKQEIIAAVSLRNLYNIILNGGIYEQFSTNRNKTISYFQTQR